jgi:hypothetical protein
MAAQTFYQVVSEAIRDFEENGFDSIERLQYWIDRIRKSAAETLTPESVLNNELQRAIGGIYKRMVDDGQMLKSHKGIERYTIERLKPQLRAQLERSMAASRGLIKLNREQAVEKAVQRMAGWASSIPAGGSRAVEVKDTKDHIRKALTSLPFEERRCIIDQSAKFVSSLNDIIATDGGAIAGRWHSKFRMAGYNYRIDHKERDGLVYAIRGNWAIEKGLMKPGDAGYTDQITKPAEEVFCFPGDSKVPYAGLVEKAYRRWYSGELTEIVTSTGKTLRATPNHPVLTSAGWKAVGSLNVGDDIIEVSEELIKPLEENQYDGITSIAEIFGAVEKNGIIETLDLRPADFHGDGRQGDVDVVLPAGELRFDFITSNAQSFDKFNLTKSDHSRLGLSGLAQRLFAALGAANGVMRLFDNCRFFFAGKSGHVQETGLRRSPKHNPRLLKAFCDWAARNAQAFRDVQHAFSADVCGNDGFSIQRVFFGSGFGSVSELEAGRVNAVPESVGVDADDLRDLRDGLPFGSQRAYVVEVNRSWFSGHVFNLQTEHSLYVVNGILAHNCGCSYQFLYNLRDLPEEMLTAKGREALAEARGKITAMR